MILEGEYASSKFVVCASQSAARQELVIISVGSNRDLLEIPFRLQCSRMLSEATWMNEAIRWTKQRSRPTESESARTRNVRIARPSEGRVRPSARRRFEPRRAQPGSLQGINRSTAAGRESMATASKCCGWTTSDAELDGNRKRGTECRPRAVTLRQLRAFPFASLYLTHVSHSSAHSSCATVASDSLRFHSIPMLPYKCDSPLLPPPNQSSSIDPIPIARASLGHHSIDHLVHQSSCNSEFSKPSLTVIVSFFVSVRFLNDHCRSIDLRVVVRNRIECLI